MAYGHELRMIAMEAERREEAISRLAFCFDTYLDFTQNGRQPTTCADGSVTMDANGATRQLCEAIRAVLGLPPDDAEPPMPIDDGSCDPLYGQRMDSADMGEN